MAFTGAAVIKKVADGLLRITGLSLAAGAAGTIGLHGGAGEVDLPQDPTQDWGPYGDVTLQDAVQVSMVPVTDVANFAIPIRVVKTGTTLADFLITLTNDEAAVASADLEIYVRYH